MCHNNPSGREETEWANFWYAEANKSSFGNCLGGVSC